MHGLDGHAFAPLDPSRFSSCRHMSWFFLPWHRIYLYFFERIVQTHLDDPTWSLPYWDWSAVGDPIAQQIPEPFRVPADPRTNPLFTTRRDPQLNDAAQPTAMELELIDARPSLRLPAFSVPPGSTLPSFGGGAMRGTAPVSNARGSLEDAPHGLVHVFVGGDRGWMGDFSTAALDPLFWLHHANVDRLWDVWIGHWGAGALPADPIWLETEFRFFDGHGTEAALRIRDVLDSASLGYVYESIDPPADTFADAPPTISTGVRQMRVAEGVELVPELLGAESGISFATRAEVPIALDATARAAGFASAARAEDARWYLRVEDIEGRAPAARAYAVYVNLPPGAAVADHPGLRAGVVASFGIREATAADNGLRGLSDAFDITEVVAQQADWDQATVTVTVVPLDAQGNEVGGGDVRAGRISVYVG
jgi:tyrosinase